jgi:hypothetical protein
MVNTKDFFKSHYNENSVDLSRIERRCGEYTGIQRGQARIILSFRHASLILRPQCLCLGLHWMDMTSVEIADISIPKHPLLLCSLLPLSTVTSKHAVKITYIVAKLLMLKCRKIK